MNKKGFTLTELLVVVVILGIIAGMTIPLIRGLSNSFNKKKYENYKDSVLAASKLYTDSYSEDLFGHNEYGCAYIKYEKLVERNLIKDFDETGVSCNSDKTYVRVVKQGDKYGYKAFLTCGKDVNGTVGTVTVSLPASIPAIDLESCNGTEYTLDIDADLTQTRIAYDKKRKTTKLTIKSYTGIDNNISIYAKWSTNPNDHGSGFTQVGFKVKGDQEATLLNGDPVKSTSKELITPENAEGEWYLVVRVDHLQDLYGHQWKNPDNTNSKYISFGPFSVDNTPPTIVANAYKCSSGNKIDSNATSLSSKTQTGGEATVDLTSVANHHNHWLNNANYPYGICFKFELKDNAIVKSSEWKWNKGGYDANATASAYKVLDGGSTPKTYSSGTTQVFNSFFSDDGHRYGQMIVKDLAGNKTVLNFDVKIDKVAPVCGTPSPNNPGWTASDRTINQPCTDKHSGCTQSTFSKTYKATTFDGSQTIEDIAGNTKSCGYSVKVDKTPPRCGTPSPYDPGWTRYSRTINQPCSDSESGCVKSPYSNSYSSSTTSDSVTISDKVGNTTSCSYYVRVDTTDPACWYSKIDTGSEDGVYAYFGCSDSGGSGISCKTGYSYYTSSVDKTVYDGAGNSDYCYMSVSRERCGYVATSDWYAYKVVYGYDCPSSNDSYQYDISNCATTHGRSTCSSCSSKCSVGEVNACNYYCVERRSRRVKYCYY